MVKQNIKHKCILIFPWSAFIKTKLVTNFSMSDIPLEPRPKIQCCYVQDMNSITVRAAVAELSLSDGQGFIKCNCSGDCKQMRCSCRSAGLACSSKCHGKQFVCSNNKDHEENKVEEELKEQDQMEIVSTQEIVKTGSKKRKTLSEINKPAKKTRSILKKSNSKKN